MSEKIDGVATAASINNIADEEDADPTGSQEYFLGRIEHWEGQKYRAQFRLDPSRRIYDADNAQHQIARYEKLLAEIVGQ